MSLMQGKKGIIFGVSNSDGIAYGIAKQIHAAGAEIAFTYANKVMESSVRPLAEEMNSDMIAECDVTNEEQIEEVFTKYEQTYDKLDFVIHAVAYADKEDIEGEFINTSKAGWNLALGVSAYSLVTIAKHARPLFNEGGSILALTYMGSEKVVAKYNIMGVAKAALESSARYLASDLGKQGVRVNCLSAGEVKTLATKGILDFDMMLNASVLKSPLKRNVTTEDIGKTALYLVSDLASGVTGEVVHVDCGTHSVYASIDEMNAIKACNKKL